MTDAQARLKACPPNNCTYVLRESGKAYPRTCQRCGLGPCPYFDKPARTPDAQPSSTDEVERVVSEIAAERQRQVEAEGWTPEHDDTHNKGEMAVAAACYADPNPARYGDPRITTPVRWAEGVADWDWNPKDRRRNLIRSAALIVAEIERLDRAAIAAMVTKP